MLVPDYSNRDYWKAIILYGLNNATYKIALGKTLLELAGRNVTHVLWNLLAEEFLKQYKDRLDKAVMPQQANPHITPSKKHIVGVVKLSPILWHKGTWYVPPTKPLTENQ